MFRHLLCVSSFALVAFAALAPSQAAELVIDTNVVKAPKIAPASDEGELAMKRFRIPKGFKVELFAAEPLLANPVAFSIDEKGRFFVVETFRLHAGVTDIRSHMTWLDEELASQSVENRVEYMRRFEGKRIDDYTRETDRLKLIWDSNGDGKADKSTVFATGFNNIEDGLASGVLAYRGNVYFANIPKLWLLRDNDHDGVVVEEGAAPRLRRARRFSRARPARAAHRAGRQIVFHHRRPRRACGDEGRRE